jgi:hypothetical protein
VRHWITFANRSKKCIFYKGSTILVVYVDDGIFFGPGLKAIEQAMKDLDAQGFNLELMGDVKDYLGIHFEKILDDRIKISQPRLTEQILKDVGLSQGANTKSTPCRQSILLYNKICEGPRARGSSNIVWWLASSTFWKRGCAPTLHTLHTNVHILARRLDWRL